MLSFIVVQLLAFVRLAVSAFVFSMFYKWFAVPFLNVPALSYKTCVALMLVVGALFADGSFSRAFMRVRIDELAGRDEDLVDGVKEQLITIFALYPLLLGVGAIWHWILS